MLFCFSLSVCLSASLTARIVLKRLSTNFDEFFGRAGCLISNKWLDCGRLHTSVGHKYIKYKGCKLWNNLPLDLKSITSNKSFNNKLKIFLRSSSD